MTVRDAGLSGTELDLLHQYRLLTAKDRLVVANISEADVGAREAEWISKLAEAVSEPEWKVVAIAASLEAELATLSETEHDEFLEGWGIAERGLSKLVRAGYALLGLVTFFTIKGTETRAWTVAEGTPIAEAAGKIHSDMEKGFIRAKIVAADDLIEHRTMPELQQQGLVKTVGKEHLVEDGEVIEFLFSG